MTLSISYEKEELSRFWLWPELVKVYWTQIPKNDSRRRFFGGFSGSLDFTSTRSHSLRHALQTDSIRPQRTFSRRLRRRVLRPQPSPFTPWFPPCPAIALLPAVPTPRAGVNALRTDSTATAEPSLHSLRSRWRHSVQTVIGSGNK